MAEVKIIPSGDVAGVWVGCDRGIVGVVAVEHEGVRLVAYPPGTPMPGPGHRPPHVPVSPGPDRPGDGYQPTVDQAAAAALLVLERGEAGQAVTRDEFARAANAVRGALWRRRWAGHPFRD